MSKLLINQSTLSSIGDAIRTKNGTTEPIPVVGLADAILNIQSGYKTIPVEVIGDVANFNYQGRWDNAIIEGVLDCTFTDITNATNMFEGSKLEYIPDIDFKDNTDFTNMFKNCSNLKEAPNFTGTMKSDDYDWISVDSMFHGCHNLRYIPEDYLTKLRPEGSTENVAYGHFRYIFYDCHSLRQACDLSFFYEVTDPYLAYDNLFYRCYALDEIKNLPVLSRQYNDDTLTPSLGPYQCHRLKNYTFKPSSEEVEWKSSIYLNLSKTWVGYGPIENIIGYNSGITADKEVYDDATYQALKNDPDWFTQDVAYSRYNRISAVNTINSLPTVVGVPAYLSPTIKFEAAAGSKTDGGAIGDLTEEEIAVAVNKNWTVAFE